MRLNVAALGTFYEMADEGAGLAAARLAPMTGHRPRVTGTRLHFSSPDAIRTSLDDGHRMGIRARLEGGLDGSVLVLFERDAAESLSHDLLEEAIPAGDGNRTAMRESAVTEAGQILTSGFVDGWADVLDTHIRMDAPTYVEGTEAEAFLTPSDFMGLHSDLALVFTSEVVAAGTDVSFTHYLLPDHDSIAELFALRGAEEGIAYEKFQGFDRMATRGAETVAEHLSKMTDIDVGVEVRRVNFVSLDAIPGSVPTERHVSVAFSFDGLPSGYLLFLFSEDSARALVEATAGGIDGEGLGHMGRSAIKELSNVMASGLLDGWANMLDTTIDHSTPAYAHDMGAAVIDPLAVGLGATQEFAFVFDTHITATETALDLDIYAIPDEESLELALDRLDVSRVDHTPTQAEFTSAAADVSSNPADVGDHR